MELSRRKALALGGGVVLGTLAAGAGTASAATPWVRLPIVTANIGRKNLGAREAAIRAVRNADDKVRPLVGWQEIREGDTGEPAMIDKHFGSNYRNTFLRHESAYRVPISIPKPWVVVAGKTTFGHGGISGVTPARWVTEVVVQHSTYPAIEFALINTHYIANAYNGANRTDLRDEWRKLRSAHANRVIAHHDKGRLVIWTADVNNPNFTHVTARDTERRVFGSGIDRINWLPGNGTVQLDYRGRKIVEMNVDIHNARVGIFNIRAV